MRVESSKVITLRDTITEEIFKAMGLKKGNIFRGMIHGLLLPVTTHFARIAERFVREAAEISVSESARRTLKDFSMTAVSRGEEHIPITGPALVAINHPGALDSLALVSRVPRNDVKILVSDSAFMREFAGNSPFFIFVDFKTTGGMLALRDSIKLLQNGGLVLMYAHGEVEPDPELDPAGAEYSISEWSRSIEILIRKVPETQLILGVMSGAVMRKFLRSPLVLLREKSFEKQKLAEFIQVIQQLIFPKSVKVNIHLTFGSAHFSAGSNKDNLLPSVIIQQKQLLKGHLQWLSENKIEFE